MQVHISPQGHDMEKHVFMKEFQLVRLLNTDLANMIATDFLPADTPQIRMFNWIEMKDELKLRLTSDSLQLEHSKDLKDVINNTSFKWRRAFARAVGHISHMHMRRLFFQICSAPNTFARRTLVIPSSGKLVKTGSNVSSESQTLLNSELELLRDKTRKNAEDLAKHCGICPEGIYCTDCVYRRGHSSKWTTRTDKLQLDSSWRCTGREPRLRDFPDDTRLASI